MSIDFTEEERKVAIKIFDKLYEHYMESKKELSYTPSEPVDSKPEDDQPQAATPSQPAAATVTLPEVHTDKDYNYFDSDSDDESCEFVRK